MRIGADATGLSPEPRHPAATVAAVDHGYEEFGLLHENAAEVGLTLSDDLAVRRTHVEVAPGRRVSAIVWGVDDPEIVLLHGGAQNAHTWDTVAIALDRKSTRLNSSHIPLSRMPSSA